MGVIVIDFGQHPGKTVKCDRGAFGSVRLRSIYSVPFSLATMASYFAIVFLLSSLYKLMRRITFSAVLTNRSYLTRFSVELSSSLTVSRRRQKCAYSGSPGRRERILRFRSSATRSLRGSASC